MFHRNIPYVVFAILLATACTDHTSAPDNEFPPEIPAQPNRDSTPGGLFHDFFEEGKFDTAGHPIGGRGF